MKAENEILKSKLIDRTREIREKKEEIEDFKKRLENTIVDLNQGFEGRMVRHKHSLVEELEKLRVKHK